MRPTGEVEDVEAYAAELAAALYGPARARARLVAELREGLADTVAAYAAEGLPQRLAVRRAVAEFGTVEEVAPSCQRELTVVQVRHTARAVALTAPFLAACWWLFLVTGQGVQLPPEARFLALPLAGAAAGAALLAAAALAATGALARRLPARLSTAHRLPRATAWAGTATGVTLGLSALALFVSSPLAANWPLVAFTGALAAVSHTVVAASARACRQCVRTG
ncbi:permease prefix domain 1-containing protein [Streptomyces sp. TRM 70361]|uniref:permease prefix domain 1-containing protein n=1 Tax=Streptomyces sp. TRM 70361 TaxID=3116553 RepID=UPI002E7C3F9F|nr:permease prefix domain 1-containing protein [Streptomyces sp. TRM 70361]MEE1942417.1 permease prefix domain 1-containing protein [Streptomyces sp. TRM 70361]